MNGDAKRVERLYDSRKRWTDFAQNLAAFGSLNRFRKMAVDALAVGRGATVLDLCCGAGGNFQYLYDAVGPQGKIVGWDLSSGMLKVAHKLVQQHGWQNIHLIRGNAERLGFPPIFDGVISTYSMSIVPDHLKVQEAVTQVLKPAGRLVIFDRRLKPGGAMRNTLNNFIRLGGPRWHADWTRTPWEDLKKWYDGVHMEEVFMGLYYLAWGYKKKG